MEIKAIFIRGSMIKEDVVFFQATQEEVEQSTQDPYLRVLEEKGFGRPQFKYLFVWLPTAGPYSRVYGDSCAEGHNLRKLPYLQPVFAELYNNWANIPDGTEFWVDRFKPVGEITEDGAFAVDECVLEWSVNEIIPPPPYDEADAVPTRDILLVAAQYKKETGHKWHENILTFTSWLLLRQEDSP